LRSTILIGLKLLNSFRLQLAAVLGVTVLEVASDRSLRKASLEKLMGKFLSDYRTIIATLQHFSYI
jgi:hypothetical protein